MLQSGAIRFPTSRGVLWDRSPLRHPIFIKPSNSIPSLYLTPADIHSLLSTINSVSQGSTDFECTALTQCATVISFGNLSLSDSQSSILKAGLLDQIPTYVLCFPDSRSHTKAVAECSLTIPFQTRQDSSLNFKSESTA